VQLKKGGKLCKMFLEHYQSRVRQTVTKHVMKCQEVTGTCTTGNCSKKFVVVLGCTAQLNCVQ
jgi:hypothetical protein